MSKEYVSIWLSLSPCQRLASILSGMSENINMGGKKSHKVLQKKKKELLRGGLLNQLSQLLMELSLPGKLWAIA